MVPEAQLDALLAQWAEVNSPAQLSVQAVRNRIVLSGQPEVVSHDWWLQFTKRMVTNAIAVARMRYA